MKDMYEKVMCSPSKALINDIKNIKGDIMILGAGGKMGPTLCKLLANGIKDAGVEKKVYAVSRFTDQNHVNDLISYGIIVLPADLLDEDHLKNLPLCENIIYMAGRKFGTSEDSSLTYAMNVYLPGRVAEKYKDSNIVVFSSGNVYPYVPLSSGGATEETPVDPVGVYAQSCVGRENVFKYFSGKYNTKILLYRLNYAIDLKYGILMEIAKAVKNQTPIDLSTGNVNVIWQGFANEIAIRALLHCNCPAEILNVTGPETVSIRWLAEEFAKRFEIKPVFEGSEQNMCLLSNSSKSNKVFGYPNISLAQMIDMTYQWIENQGETTNKPTHFQERKGNY